MVLLHIKSLCEDNPPRSGEFPGRFLLKMATIYGQKIGMTVTYDENGRALPITVILAGPNTVLSTQDSSGTKFALIGYGKPSKNLKKSVAGQFKTQQTMQKIGSCDADDLKPGDKIDVSNFKIGDKVDITGQSKGKGFTGVIRRYGFSRGPMTHGSDHQRSTGAIGSAYPQRVFAGHRMHGHLGATRITLKKQEIIGIDKENNLFQIKGSIPGANKSFVRISN